MEEGKIVFQGLSPKGKFVIIRYPRHSDLQAMWKYINALSKERTFIRYQGEEISYESEERYLNEILLKIKNNFSVQLLLFYQNTLIGTSGISMSDRIHKHTGSFGISVAKEFRGEGLGQLLMSTVFKEAEKQLPNLEIVTLTLFDNNETAKRMYNKFGFVEYGRLPKGLKIDEKYIDHLHMYKNIKSKTINN